MSLKMKKILITGASGYLGRNLSKYLKKKKFKVYIISKKKISGTIHLGKSLKKNNIKKINKFDLIIHCAAKGVYKNENKKILHKVNFTESINFFKKLYKNQNYRWIFIGTSSEYGYIKNKASSVNNTKLKPIDEYGKSKVRFYLKIKKMKLKENFQILYLRLFHVYGGDEPKTRLYPSLLEAIKSKKNFKMTDGSENRDFIKINTVLNKINKSLAYFNKKDNFFITKHIANGKKTSVKNFANQLWKKHKSKQKIIYNAISKKNGYHSMYSDKASLI